MASAFANNTQHMNSSDKISNSKAKTNYNYLRLVSKTNRKSTSCYEDYITSSSGNVVLKTQKKIETDEDSQSVVPISQLVRASSYELLRSINKGYYLPTSIPKGEINRPPYTYGEKCLNSDNKMKSQNPNTSGDLQDILFNEYLDFGNLTLITNTKFITSDSEITKINNGLDNELQIIDASFGDYIIDPDNILNNFKDCNLSTYLGLENENNILEGSLEGSLQGSFNEFITVDYDNPFNFAISHIDEHENIALTGGSGQGAIVSVKVDVYNIDTGILIEVDDGSVDFILDPEVHIVRVSAINITNGGEGYVVGDDLTLTLILPGGSITISETFTLTNTNLYSEEKQIVQWRQINTNNFPSNKYKKFGSNKPIFFYDYDKCVNN